MRLAEALLRVPDAETAIALTADQLGRADFDAATATASRRIACWPACRRARSRCRSAGCRGRRRAAGPARSGSGARTVVAATVRAIQLLGRQFVLGRHIGEAHGRSRGQRREAADAALLVRHARRGRAHRRATRVRYLAATDDAIGAIAAQARRRRRHAGTARRHLDQAVGAASRATRSAARARVRRAGAARVVAASSSPRAADINLTIDAEESDRLELSLDVLDALAAHRAAACAALARLRPGRAGLPDARRWRSSTKWRASRARARPALHGAAGQGRLLGRRDQARAGRGLRRLPGVHAQAAHRHRLPGLRARAAGAPRRDLSAVRHAQRRHHRGHRADGARARRRVRDAAPARHGRGRRTARCMSALPRCRCASMRRWASTATCWPTSCAGCWRTAPTRRSCTSSPTTACRSTTLLASPLQWHAGRRR